MKGQKDTNEVESKPQPPTYKLEREVIFEGKTFKPDTVTQQELSYLAKFPDSVPFVKTV